MESLEDRDVVAPLREVRCAGQSGRAGADHSDFFRRKDIFGIIAAGGDYVPFRSRLRRPHHSLRSRSPRFRAAGGTSFRGHSPHRLIIGEGMVSHKALELADSDTLSLYSEDAAALALGLLRADTAADRRQRGILRDDSRGSLDVTLFDLRDELGNLDADRASGHTARILAMEAT